MLKLISSVQHISGNKHHNDGNGQFDVMREIILRTFARLFALMGCTTIVTACYGVPYENFDVKMSGFTVMLASRALTFSCLMLI